jgi:hypothetical protein
MPLAAAKQDPYTRALRTAHAAAVGDADHAPHLCALADAHVSAGLADGRADLLHAARRTNARPIAGPFARTVGVPVGRPDADTDGLAVGLADGNAEQSADRAAHW